MVYEIWGRTSKDEPVDFKVEVEEFNNMNDEEIEYLNAVIKKVRELDVVSINYLQPIGEDDLPEEVQYDKKIFEDCLHDEELLEDNIADQLSDDYGYCVYTFNYEVTENTICVSDIEWDTEE